MRHVLWSVTLATVVSLLVLPGFASARALTSRNILTELNAARVKAKMSTLHHDLRLDQAARSRATALIKAATLNHGTTATKAAVIVRQTGYRARATGEILAADFMTAEDTVSAWNYSVVHRKIMYDARYRDVGVAVINNPKRYPFSLIVVVIFGQKSGL